MSPDEVHVTFDEMIDAEIAREEGQAAQARDAALVLLLIGASSVIIFGLAIIGAVTVVRWAF